MKHILPFALLPLAAVSISAIGQSVQVGTVEGWVLYDEKGKCAASTLYEGDTYVRVAYDFGNDSAWLTVADPAWKAIEDGKKYKVQLRFSNGQDWGDVNATGLRVDDKEAALTGILLHLDGDDFLRDFAAAPGMSLRMGDVRVGSYSLQGTRTVVERLSGCAVDTYKRNPPDPFAGVSSSGSGSTRARGNLASVISNADYPDAALRAGEQGRVGFKLTVGTDGRVIECAITSSSGSTSLDSATCRILRARSRFSPARNADGTLTTDSVESFINWALPASG